MLSTNNTLEKSNVTLKILIESKILSAGQQLVCANPNINGLLNNDGSITINIDGTEKVFDFLSGAARHIEKRSLNGWIYWSVIIDGKKHNLDSFRNQYLKRKNISQA